VCHTTIGKSRVLPGNFGIEKQCVIYCCSSIPYLPVPYAFRLVVILLCVGSFSSAASRRINALQIRSTSCGDRDATTGTLFVTVVLFSGCTVAFSGTFAVAIVLAFLTRVPQVCLHSFSLPSLFILIYRVTYLGTFPYEGVSYPLNVVWKW
jgi:hypothetical protein